MARFANEAYKQKNKRAKELYGYTYEPKFSDTYHAVYVDEKEEKVILAIAGTELKKTKGRAVEDLINDGLLFIGFEKYGTRYRKAMKKLSDIVSHYKGYKVILVGHSLSGSIVTDLGKRYKFEYHVYNPGNYASLKATAKVKEHVLYDQKKEPDPLQNIYLVSGDPISPLSVLDKEATIHHVKKTKNKYAAHSLEQFLTDDTE
jgi:putative lipase involved disintegration of autophagic bodies